MRPSADLGSTAGQARLVIGADPLFNSRSKQLAVTDDSPPGARDFTSFRERSPAEMADPGKADEGSRLVINMKNGRRH